MSAIQKNDSYIGELLIRDGIISHDDLKKGLQEQKQTNDFLCSTLVKMGMASEERIYSILSLQIGIPYLSLKGLSIDPLAVNRLPGRLSETCGCLVFKVIDDTYYVAMTDPLDGRAIEEIKGYLGTQSLKVFLAGDEDFRQTLRKYYSL
ncbi:MAG: hypothetical protein WC732_04040 [Candidatus Omnitrophota bacterium]